MNRFPGSGFQQDSRFRFIRPGNTGKPRFINTAVVFKDQFLRFRASEYFRIDGQENPPRRSGIKTDHDGTFRKTPENGSVLPGRHDFQPVVRRSIHGKSIEFRFFP